MAYSWFGTRLRILSGAAALTLSAFAAMPSAAHADSITLYNAQHEQVVNLLAKDFEKQSGISVRIRNGEGPAMAAQMDPERHPCAGAIDQQGRRRQAGIVTNQKMRFKRQHRDEMGCPDTGPEDECRTGQPRRADGRLVRMGSPQHVD